MGIVGFFREDRVKSRHKGMIFGMFVRPEFRGRGIGTALMDAILAQVRPLPGLERVLIDVVAGNDTALGLYERCGFVAFGIEPEAKKHHGVATDMIHMSLRL